LVWVQIPDQVEDNIATIAQLRDRIARDVSRHQRVMSHLAQRLGRPFTVYALIVFVFGWIAVNVAATHLGFRPVDRFPFPWLQGMIACYAALMTTLVVVAQSRQQVEAEYHAHLELQLNLLAEQKTTKIIALVEELRRDLPNVRDRADPVAEAMQEEIDPQAVHSALTRTD
jgi:uncharacterized membrane protein